MITYTHPGNGAPKNAVLAVRLERRHIGYIRQNEKTKWYYYRPLGSKLTGEEFETIAEVKASIEEE